MLVQWTACSRAMSPLPFCLLVKYVVKMFVCATALHSKPYSFYCHAFPNLVVDSSPSFARSTCHCTCRCQGASTANSRSSRASRSGCRPWTCRSPRLAAPAPADPATWTSSRGSRRGGEGIRRQRSAVQWGSAVEAHPFGPVEPKKERPQELQRKGMGEMPRLRPVFYFDASEAIG